MTDSTTPTPQHWHLPALRLCLLVFAVMGASIGYEFVNWDDPWYVLNNPYTTSWSPSNLKAITTEVVNRNYAPLTMFTLLVERTLFGLDPRGYHAFNLALHATNAVLVYLLLQQLTRRQGLAFWTAAIFAIHPVQLEAVVWVSSLKGLLCSAFILAHLICWLRPERTPRQEAWGLVWFALALHSKALTVVVPAIVWLYDVLVLRKSRGEASARQFIPGLLSLWLLLTTIQAQDSVLGGMRGHFELSKAQILAVDSIVLWKYVGMLVCPTDLCVLYDPPTRGIAVAASIATVAWGLVSWRLWRVRERYPLLVMGLVSAFILLLPVLNLTRITTLMNDRYLYLPLIPFFAALLAGLYQVRDWVSERLKQSSQCWYKILPQLLRLVPHISVVVFAMLSMRHMPVWRNDQALWEHTASKLPHVPVVRVQYAWLLKHHHQEDDALAVMQSTLDRFHPDALDRERIARTMREWREGE